MKPRKKQAFQDEVLKKLAEKFGIENPMALPRLQKVVVSVGLGDSVENNKLNPVAREATIGTLRTITGQEPVITKARKSVANFDIREGAETGAMVTLRGNRMWEFFDRLVSLAVPRIKDFRGLPVDSFDGSGNYSFGIQEQGVFPEVNMADAKYTHGMNITFVFRNSDSEKSEFILRELGMPLQEAA
ncbi:MAG: 50S ribosomal protein L5 [Phycisphaeraceae bacterium]|nr:50S ribosomal protein L5 [Phycisphaeraceae bacterium]